MASVFERIRAAVFQEATRPSPYDAGQHAANQAKFKETLQRLCNNAHLRGNMTIDDLWRHVWTKTRYAGFKAAYVGLEIPRLTPFFGDFRVLTGPEWSFDPDGITHGEAVREFLGKTGRFVGISYNKKAAKLQNILTTAAAFQAFPPGSQALAALFGDDYAEPDDEALWRAHRRLAELVGFTTALHVMMDIGFNCVKPDIWMVRLMCRLGWIDDAFEESYLKPRTAVEVITRARQTAKEIHAWHPEAPLRELDFVMVKYGQKPGEHGITRSLHETWLPVERIMEWHPSDRPT